MSQEPTLTYNSVSNYTHLKQPFSQIGYDAYLVCKQVPAEAVYHVRIPALGIGKLCCSQEGVRTAMD
jgi:hypothetical protein